MSILDEMSISGVFKFGFYVGLIIPFCLGFIRGYNGFD